MGSANTSLVWFKRQGSNSSLKKKFISSTLCPRNLHPLPSHQNAQKSNGWYGHCRPLCRRCLLSSKNVTELMLMNTLTLPHLLMGMQNLLPLTVPQLHPMMPQLLHMVNQLHHTESQHPAMVLPKPTCLTSPQSSLVS